MEQALVEQAVVALLVELRAAERRVERPAQVVLVQQQEQARAAVARNPQRKPGAVLSMAVQMVRSRRMEPS